MKKQINYIVFFIIFFLLLNFVGGKILLAGIDRFYGLKQYSELLLIGHSHLMLATDKKALEKETGKKISKYTREGVNVVDRYYMVEQYLNSKYSDSLKVVFYGVDQFTFTSSGLSDNSYKLFYPFMGDSIMDEFVKRNEKNEGDYYKHKWLPLTRYSDVLINASLRGWRNDFSNYKNGTIDMDSYRERIKNNEKQFNRDIEMNPDLMAIFEETIDRITQKNIQVVLVNTPLVDVLNNAGSENYREMIDFYKNYALTHELVDYWDFNPEYSSDYSIFHDPIHLNPKGQKIITSEIITRINNMN
ncbi:hypothetical protein AGMMS50262_10800 [Bacteroidia bacterium]|nr:hypothetical protein AGMMS50262_10800 [Bacteroidia bacterium]